MVRPCCKRNISGQPLAAIFKPVGIPHCELDELVLALDEFEALRLVDLNGQYHEQAATQMGVSRPTLSRILDAAHQKVADALVHGKALRIEGGPVVSAGPRRCCKAHRPISPNVHDARR